jgi:hypothetical protein
MSFRTALRRAVLAIALLAVPLAVLLAAQWPLRELVQAYSRQANDVAQILFALYVAVAVTVASAAGSHLSAAHAGSLRKPWRAWALLACVGPWALFMLWNFTGPALAATRLLERFSETLDPGFFAIRLALLLLAGLVLAEALWRTLRPAGDE